MIESRPRRAAVYARISKDPTGTMLGVERQRADCAALVEARGWDLAGIYVDNDVSAYSGKRRPEYERLLADLRAGDVDAVVAWHPDRLHRSPKELEPFIDAVESRGAAVETVTAGPVDLTTPSGRAVARTLGAWARYESEHKAERLTRKAQERAELGLPSRSGTRAFGLTREWSAIVPAEAELIREGLARILAGDSIRAICIDWNARGLVTTTGGRWQPGPLRRMLTSGYLAGLRELRGYERGTNGSMTRRARPAMTVAGTWPAIIDADTLERVRAVLRDPSRRTAGTNARSYLLSGFVVCGTCGGRMVARPREDHVRRYLCAKGPMYQGCGTAILAEPVEELIAEAVLVRLDSPAFEAAIRAAGEDAAGAPTVARLRDDEAALEDLARDHYVDRIIGRAEYLAARKALEGRIETARRRLAAGTTAGTAAMLAGTARNRWPTLTFDARRTVIGTLVERITVGPGRRGYNRFDPARVSVEWRA